MNMSNPLSNNKRGLLSVGPTEHQATAKRPAVQAVARNRALAALKSTYGYEAFRGHQEAAVLAALAGRDVLVIMPTGGGKTLCYVIPALVQPGVCIVVSPLLALMQDQVANLTRVGVRAAQLSSALSPAQRAATLTELEGGGGGGGPPRIRVLLATPELLAASDRFRGALRRLHAHRNIALFAVDESHCISTWGHDFRPAYRRLQVLRRDFPGVPIMALTATAASKVQDDICQQLRLQNPVRLLSSFNRPNISYTVRYLDAEEVEAAEALVRLLRAQREATASPRGGGGDGAVPCSIVYCQKRQTCEEVALRLCREGLPAAAYHGSMSEADKKEVLRRWQADEIPVVVATIAFGMGIDKSGVRLVVHFNLPRSLEGFYQESGRAGRDAGPADSVLFYSREARCRMDFVLKQDQDKKAKRKQPGRRGGGAGVPGGDSAGGDEEEGDEGGGVGVGSGGGAELEGEEAGVAAEAAAIATADEQAQVNTTAWEAFGRVVEWAMAAGCRRRALLAHFGENAPPGRCGGMGDGRGAGCDYCRDPSAVEAQLQRQRTKDADAAARQQGGGWRGGGGGKVDDEEADMFAVRGGVSDAAANGGGSGGGEGGDDGHGTGPGFYHAGRRSPPECPARVAEARSAAAAARAAAGGRVNAKYFAALAAREREAERREREATAGDVVDRMLAAGGSGLAAAAPPPDAAARINAASKLATALGAGRAGACVEPSLLKRLAEAVEADVYGNGLPRQQYMSRMAGLLSRAKGATSLLALLPQSRAAGGGGSGSPAPSPPSGELAPPFAVLLPGLLQAEISAIESLLDQAPISQAASMAAGGGVAKAGHSSGGGSGAGSPTDMAASRLGALAAVAVTAEAIKAGDVGRRVVKLGRHRSPQVAEAARRAVAAWKRQLPEPKKLPPPPQPA